MPLVQLGVSPPGHVIPVTDSVPVPLLPMVSVNSDAFPDQNGAKGETAADRHRLVAAEAGVDVEVGVGEVGLAFSQADAVSAMSTTTRQSERMRGDFMVEPWICKPRTFDSGVRAVMGGRSVRVFRTFLVYQRSGIQFGRS